MPDHVLRACETFFLLLYIVIKKLLDAVKLLTAGSLLGIDSIVHAIDLRSATFEPEPSRLDGGVKEFRLGWLLLIHGHELTVRN